MVQMFLAELNGVMYPACGSGLSVHYSIFSTDKVHFLQVSQGPDQVTQTWPEPHPLGSWIWHPPCRCAQGPGPRSAPTRTLAFLLQGLGTQNPLCRCTRAQAKWPAAAGTHDPGTHVSSAHLAGGSRNCFLKAKIIQGYYSIILEIKFRVFFFFKIALFF